jgi:DNA polymerase III epsilon subunit-like protein
MTAWFRFGRGRRDLMVPPGTPLHSARYVVLDTELTSLKQRSNRLLSIGAIGMVGAKIRIGEQFYRVVNPGVAVPAKSVLVHKLRPVDVNEGKPPLEALRELREFIADAVLVGHFVNVDLKVLAKELDGSGHELNNPALDTARVQRWIVRQGRYTEDQFHQLENVDLASLARNYGLDLDDAHHALNDAFLTARLWQKLLHAAEELGIRTIGDVLRIGKAR